MESIEGIVIFAQESRFQVLDTSGVAHHLILSRTAAADPEQLSALQRNQAHVVVRCRAAPDLLAREAVRIDVFAG